MAKRTLCAVALVVVMGGMMTAQNVRGAGVGLLKKNGDNVCAWAGFRDETPTDSSIAAACTVDQDNVRTRDGRVVTAIAIYPWKDGAGQHVRVSVMVPRPGTENRKYTRAGDDLTRLVPLRLADYAITAAGTKVIVEMRDLGVDPWLLAVTR
jgi:hypothetical protein